MEIALLEITVFLVVVIAACTCTQHHRPYTKTGKSAIAARILFRLLCGPNEVERFDTYVEHFHAITRLRRMPETLRTWRSRAIYLRGSGEMPLWPITAWEQAYRHP